jgi:molybdopterin synthase catalytic subunit
MIVEQDISLDTLVRRMKKREMGAILTFLGVVRDEAGLRGLEIEIKDNVEAEKELEKLRSDALETFDIEAVEIVHRCGPLRIGDTIVAIAVGAKHREEAFRACEYLIDRVRVSETIKLREVK